MHGGGLAARSSRWRGDDRDRLPLPGEPTQSATEPPAWWDIRQYVRHVRSNGVRIVDVLRGFLFSAYRKLVESGVGHRALIALYDRFQASRGGVPYPYRSGTCEKAPAGELGLEPGELVRVKSYTEILATLDRRNRNCGLYSTRK